MLTRGSTQILSNGLYGVGHSRKGVLYDRLIAHPMSTQYLMPTVIRFFIGELANCRARNAR